MSIASITTSPPLASAAAHVSAASALATYVDQSRRVGVAPARRDAGHLPAAGAAASGSPRRPRSARPPSTRRARNRIPPPRPRRCWRGRSSRWCPGRAHRSWASHSLRAIRDEQSVRFARRAVTSGESDARTAGERRRPRERYLDEIQERPVAPSACRRHARAGSARAAPGRADRPRATCSRCSTSSARRRRWPWPGRASSAS